MSVYVELILVSFGSFFLILPPSMRYCVCIWVLGSRSSGPAPLVIFFILTALPARGSTPGASVDLLSLRWKLRCLWPLRCGARLVSCFPSLILLGLVTCRKFLIDVVIQKTFALRFSRDGRSKRSCLSSWMSWRRPVLRCQLSFVFIDPFRLDRVSHGSGSSDPSVASGGGFHQLHVRGDQQVRSLLMSRVPTLTLFLVVLIGVMSLQSEIRE